MKATQPKTIADKQWFFIPTNPQQSNQPATASHTQRGFNISRVVYIKHKGSDVEYHPLNIVHYFFQ